MGVLSTRRVEAARREFNSSFTKVSLALAFFLAVVTVAQADESFEPDTIGVGRSPAQSDGADSPEAIKQAYAEALKLSAQGSNYQAAALYFSIYTGPGHYQSAALSHVTEELMRAGFPNAASYFFIKTLENTSKGGIRRVLPFLPALMDAVGGDLLRPYVLRHTTEADYDSNTKSHFYYFLAKDELLKTNAQNALNALAHVSTGAGILAQAAYLRGAAHAMLGQGSEALEAFKSCQRLASRGEGRSKTMKQEYLDLEARCTAGMARTYYQSGQYSEAEETYDDIPKSSFVWTDILFEQAWNSYAKGDYNRTLGKLVTYRSPSLAFVFNPEIEVLQAQTFFALCDFDDVEKTVAQFESRYADVGLQLKRFLLAHDRDLAAFYEAAKEVYHRKLHTSDRLSNALNRFIRGPYFAAQLDQERAVNAEAGRVSATAARGGHPKFARFLEKVVAWRGRTVRLLGGLFVKNSMSDLYDDMLTQVDKISYIKLETLSKTKLNLEKKTASMSEDEDGVLKKGSGDVERREYQYFWTFNGEFWADELGDYVFSLESQCGL